MFWGLNVVAHFCLLVISGFSSWFWLWVGFEDALLLFRIGFCSLVGSEVYTVGFSYPFDTYVGWVGHLVWV